MRFITKFCAVAVLLASPAVAQALRHLYASQPPAGSSFVRVINPEQQAAKVAVAGATAISLAAAGPVASPYEVVQGGTVPGITVDGRPVTIAAAPPAGAFLTYIMQKTPGGLTAAPVTDTVDQALGLKAELRFYNLVPGCTGRLDLVGGPAIFDAVPANETRRRSINPVEASLSATCGATASTPLKLPALKPADHFSVFLTGSGDTPMLAGQIDETEMQQGSAR